MKFGVVVFPGSNCDDDARHAVGEVIGQPAEFVWHQSQQLSGFDALILPGGFAYGDYLRTGAIAKFSPIMDAAKKFARSGGLILGICNGFQILTESGLLPGALMRNRRLRFLCRPVHLRVENAATPFTCAARQGDVLQIPINHGEGNYFCDSATLDELQRNRQVVLRYVHADGRDAAADDFDANPNGSLSAIAAVCNREGNVMGMMPHPERAVESVLGSEDGRVILRSMVEYLSKSKSAGAVAAERVTA